MPPASSLLAWHHLTLDLPSHWEVIAYRKDPRNGEIALADRRGETLRAFWRVMHSRPTVTGPLVDLVDAQEGITLNKAEIRRRIVEMGDWEVFLPRDRDMPCFAACYHPPEQVLLNLTFPPHADTADRAVIRRIIESWKPNDGDERRWSAFGLDVTLPNEMYLNGVSALPAAQIISFENKRDETVTVHRYGMMPLALGGEDMTAFFARIKGRGTRLVRTGSFRKDDRYDGVILEYTTRGKGGIDSLLARIWLGRVWIWMCEDLKRLYIIDHHAPEKKHIAGFPDRVRCR